jgi:predicted kinase
VLIILSGLPGAGKSTIGRAVARELGAVYLRIDSIEHAMREAGWRVEGEGYRAAYAVAEDNLRLGRIVVADSVNPWTLTRDEWRSVAHRAGVRAMDVEIVCSDPGEHRRRIDARAAGTADARVTWEDVVTRDYHSWDRERLVIDTAHATVDGCVRRIIDQRP